MLTALIRLRVCVVRYYVMDACVYVTSEYAKLYFIAFYSIAVLVVMNVLTAFVLEAFLMQQQREERIKERRRVRARRLKEREQKALDPTNSAWEREEEGDADEEEAERDEMAKAEERMQPRCFPKLKELSERELHQRVEMKKPSGMGAVLLHFYHMSVDTDEG